MWQELGPPLRPLHPVRLVSLIWWECCLCPGKWESLSGRLHQKTKILGNICIYHRQVPQLADCHMCGPQMSLPLTMMRPGVRHCEVDQLGPQVTTTCAVSYFPNFPCCFHCQKPVWLLLNGWWLQCSEINFEKEASQSCFQTLTTIICVSKLKSNFQVSNYLLF